MLTGALVALHYVHVDPVAIFVVNFVAIIPLAAMLSYATEEIALRYALSIWPALGTTNGTFRTGETIGGLLNASFG